MDSLEKLEQLKAGAAGLEPGDESSARLMQAMQLASGMGLLEQIIPDTAEELDEALLNVAKMTLEMRSDEAPVMARVATADRGT